MTGDRTADRTGQDRTGQDRGGEPPEKDIKKGGREDKVMMKKKKGRREDGRKGGVREGSGGKNGGTFMFRDLTHLSWGKERDHLEGMMIRLSCWEK
jgi:hypothetical protein